MESIKEKKVMEITSDPGDLRFLVQEMIRALRMSEKTPSSREKALAITKLQEASFWLGEEMFGGKAWDDSPNEHES